MRPRSELAIDGLVEKGKERENSFFFSLPPTQSGGVKLLAASLRRALAGLNRGRKGRGLEKVFLHKVKTLAIGRAM